MFKKILFAIIGISAFLHIIYTYIRVNGLTQEVYHLTEENKKIEDYKTTISNLTKERDFFKQEVSDFNNQVDYLQTETEKQEKDLQETLQLLNQRHQEKQKVITRIMETKVPNTCPDIESFLRDTKDIQWKKQ